MAHDITHEGQQELREHGITMVPHTGVDARAGRRAERRARRRAKTQVQLNARRGRKADVEVKAWKRTVESTRNSATKERDPSLYKVDKDASVSEEVVTGNGNGAPAAGSWWMDPKILIAGGLALWLLWGGRK